MLVQCQLDIVCPSSQATVAVEEVAVVAVSTGMDMVVMEGRGQASDKLAMDRVALAREAMVSACNIRPLQQDTVGTQNSLSVGTVVVHTV